jgi:methionyl-tRNA formyltransferase
LHDRLAATGAELLLRTLELLAKGEAPRQKQDDAKASVCKKISKEDGRIDWNLPAQELWNRIRAYNPWPSAFCHLQTPRGRKLVKIWNAAVVPGTSHKPGTVVREDKHGIVVDTGRDSLLIKEIQIEGGRRLKAADFAIGHDVQVGTVFE